MLFLPLAVYDFDQAFRALLEEIDLEYVRNLCPSHTEFCLSSTDMLFYLVEVISIERFWN